MNKLTPTEVRLEVDGLLGELAATELLNPKETNGYMLRVRIPKSAEAELRRYAEQDGVIFSDIVRQAMSDFIFRRNLAMRAELNRIRGLAPQLAQQASAIFKNLPAGEIGDDEPLHFTANQAGEIRIRVDASNSIFMVFRGAAVRLRTTGPDEAEMVIYRQGRVIERRLFTLSEMHKFMGTEVRVDDA
jgi:hypothetical protein